MKEIISKIENKCKSCKYYIRFGVYCKLNPYVERKRFMLFCKKGDKN